MYFWLIHVLRRSRRASKGVAMWFVTTLRNYELASKARNHSTRRAYSKSQLPARDALAVDPNSVPQAQVVRKKDRPASFVDCTPRTTGLKNWYCRQTRWYNSHCRDYSITQ